MNIHGVGCKRYPTTLPANATQNLLILLSLLFIPPLISKVIPIFQHLIRQRSTPASCSYRHALPPRLPRLRVGPAAFLHQPRLLEPRAPRVPAAPPQILQVARGPLLLLSGHLSQLLVL